MLRNQPRAQGIQANSLDIRQSELEQRRPEIKLNPFSLLYLTPTLAGEVAKTNF